MAILIRLAKRGDAKGIARFRNDSLRKGFANYTGSNRPLAKKDIKKYDEGYAKKERNRFVFVAIDEESRRIIGVSSFEAKPRGRTRHRGETGWMVHQDYMRRGVATKVLKAVLKEAKSRGFKRIEAEAAVENIASVKLAKKCGFRIEGRKRAGLLLDDGRYVDTYIFGKLLK